MNHAALVSQLLSSGCFLEMVKDVELLVPVQRGHEDTQRAGELCPGHRLRELGLFSLEKRKLQGDL